METPNTLFNNPAVLNAKKSLSPEEYMRYEKIGKELYETVDFNNNEILNNKKIDTNDIDYIIEGIKSGLHPSMLSTEEKKQLNNIIGKNWFEKYGYKESDLNII
jgi:hypothetical protein